TMSRRSTSEVAATWAPLPSAVTYAATRGGYIATRCGAPWWPAAVVGAVRPGGKAASSAAGLTRAVQTSSATLPATGFNAASEPCGNRKAHQPWFAHDIGALPIALVGQVVHVQSERHRHADIRRIPRPHAARRDARQTIEIESVGIERTCVIDAAGE